VLVLQVDGKGIVMRPDALRPATAKAAQGTTAKLTSRLSKGEKRYRKRIAEVGAVHDATPAPRGPTDILPATDAERAATNPGPTATNKWLTASVVQDAATVVARVFDEAERRDADHQRVWVALVDGANHQLDRIRAEATARQIEVHVLIDFVHVIEYLWQSRLVLLRRSRPGRRGMGPRQGPRRARRQGHSSSRRDPTHRHQPPADQTRPQTRRRSRALPHQQSRQPRLPHRPGQRLAHRDRRHRRRLPASGR
jgi:hypothetical protein